MVSQGPDFLLQDLLGLFSSLTSLLSPTKVVPLGGCSRLDLADPPVSFRDGPFELLKRAPMGGFAITQLHLRLMHTVLHRRQLFYLGAESIPVGEPLVELGDMLSQDPDFLLQDLMNVFSCLTSLLSPAKFVDQGGNSRIELAHALACRNSFSFHVRQPFRPHSQFCFERFQLLTAGGQLSLG